MGWDVSLIFTGMRSDGRLERRAFLTRCPAKDELEGEDRGDLTPRGVVELSHARAHTHTHTQDVEHSCTCCLEALRCPGHLPALEQDPRG